MKAFFSDRKIRRLLWAALVLAIVISGWRALTLHSRDLSVLVRVTMKTAESGTAALYYDVGKEFNSKHVSTSPVFGDGTFHDVKLKIPFNRAVNQLRFDPPATWGEKIVISKIDMIDRYGRPIHTFDLHRLRPANQISTFDLIDGNIHFTVAEKADDPQISILPDRPITFKRMQLLALMVIYQVAPEFLALSLICFFLIFVWSRWTDPVIATMVVIAICLAGWISYDDYKSVYFNVSMKTAVKGEVAGLYYDEGYGLSEDSVVHAHTYGDDLLHEYTFKIPRRISHLRFDPFMTAGTVLIKKMEITDRFGHVLKSFTSLQMSPAWEIKTFEVLDEGVKVTTEDKAVDPQIDVTIDRGWQQGHPRPLLLAMNIVLDCAFFLALLVVGIYIRKRHTEKIHQLIDGIYFQEKLPLLYLGCALGLIVAMAFISGLDVHPDEIGHQQAAAYYSDAWLPPSIEDPRILKTISGFGVSYLFRVDIIYFLSGKAALLLSAIADNEYLKLRLFNILLFFTLILIVARNVRGVPLLIWALVLTPQIWYLFSYFNGDAFAFFIAMLITVQLINPDSLTHQFLRSPSIRNHLSGGVLFGILLGVLLSSKLNYYVYIAFIFVIIAGHMIMDKGVTPWGSPLWIKKGALVACMALCIYLPPVIYDQYINDFNKNENISRFVEEHAAPPFKPSTVINRPEDSYPGLNLRSKGISWQELFLEKSYWRKLSYLSFFGLYGYMSLYANSSYYEMLSTFLFGMILFVYFYAAYTVTPKDGRVLMLALLFLLLAIGQSTYVSWAGDFEPQGRYLFPIIPIVLMGLSRLTAGFQKRIIPCFSFILFLFSMTSFVFYALLFIPKIG